MLNLEIVGQGATTTIYRDGNRAVKLYVYVPSDRAEDEAERQRFAYRAGLPVPAVFGVRKLDGNTTALDMAYIDGQPLMRPGMDKDGRDRAIRALVGLQCEVHKVRAVGQPRQTKRLALIIEGSESLDRPLKDHLIALLARLDKEGEQLCHGDLHPLNILYDGSKHWIIDWVDAAAGNVLADACRTYLIFKQNIRRMAGIYLRLFCEETGAAKEDVLAWLPVVAAARLHENMDEKQRLELLELAGKV